MITASIERQESFNCGGFVGGQRPAASETPVPSGFTLSVTYKSKTIVVGINPALGLLMILSPSVTHTHSQGNG